ncbi:UNVERIFIED_CONTAM: hypothetical protein NCL1_30739 [Trichonephila clavipes]
MQTVQFLCDSELSLIYGHECRRYGILDVVEVSRTGLVSVGKGENIDLVDEESAFLDKDDATERFANNKFYENRFPREMIMECYSYATILLPAKEPYFLTIENTSRKIIFPARHRSEERENEK